MGEISWATGGNCRIARRLYNASVSDLPAAQKTPTPITAFVLAGRRGPIDALAQAAGESHKACIPVAGVPMLTRVVRSLGAVSWIQKIVVSGDDSTVLKNFQKAPAIEFHASRHSPAASVVDYAVSHQGNGPLLVTTADHALLSPRMLEYFFSAAEQTEADADVVIGVVAASLFRSYYPASRRTFITLKDESFCGTNLFLLRPPQAANAVRFWERAGQFRKRPWRLVSEFGFVNLLRFLLRRLDRQTAIEQASRVLQAQVGIVEMPFAEAAIDVDTRADLVTVEDILAKRTRKDDTFSWEGPRGKEG